MNLALYPGVLRKGSCRMNGKLGNKIIFEAGKILWPIALTFDLSILPYSYTDRHIQYSSKILKQLCHFPKFPVDVD